MSGAVDVLLGLAGIVVAVGVITGFLAGIIRWQIKSILFHGNGGNSLSDIAAKVDHLTDHVDAIHDRTFRLERQVDQIIIPRQEQIRRTVNGDD